MSDFDPRSVIDPLTHKDGVPWYDAPIPPLKHKCTVQTAGLGARRCACGALRLTHHPDDAWVQRNERLIPQDIYGQPLSGLTMKQELARLRAEAKPEKRKRRWRR